jgi:glyoxalase family protein
MRLEGLHHITAITGDAPRNVDFYTRVLGQRMVKKTVNFDQPDAYHLYYADERARPGAVMTFFEFPNAAPGRAGAGMVHTIAYRVADAAALDFWAQRLAGEGVETARRGDHALQFADPEGLGLALMVDPTGDAPLAAEAPDIPAEHAIVGFHGVRAYSDDPQRSAGILEGTLGFSGGPKHWEARGEHRGGVYGYDEPPEQPGIPGAGTVHHVAWASLDEDHEAWRERAAQAGLHVTPVIDRDYFHSIYFREPSGVLFEIATFAPGFDVDEPMESLGEALKLPKQHEHLREVLEQRLTPIQNPRGPASAGHFDSESAPSSAGSDTPRVLWPK